MAISHAHDDHIDDYFLNKYFNKNMNIIVNEYPSPSLRNRLKLGFENISIVQKEGIKILKILKLPQSLMKNYPM